MDFLLDLELTLNTLAVFLLLPFSYFVYQRKWWYDPDKLKTADFFLGALCALLGVLLVIKIGQGYVELNREEIQLLLMHLMPVILTFFIIKKTKNILGLASELGFGSKEGQSGTKAAATQTFRPLKKEIAALTWENLIINEDVKTEMISVIDLLKDPKTAHKYGIDVPKGILLSGPPGTGKTTIAKIIANQAGLSFFSLAMNEIVSKWVGESEKNLTALFNAAKKHAPSVIFVDEVDSIGRARSGGGQQWSENLLNHLLQLIDGVIDSQGIYVIAATNRPDLVDDALKRGGRLNRVITIHLPDFESRAKLFYLYLSKKNLEPGVDLASLAKVTEGKSGADIEAICNQAGLNAFKRESAQGSGGRSYTIKPEDVERALAEFMEGQVG